MPRPRGQRRRHFVHFLLTGLSARGRRWKVGQATIYPPGDLLAVIDAHVATTTPRWRQGLIDWYREPLDGAPWSTIAIPVLARRGPIPNELVDEARDIARDVVAVLRLFQRWRVPMADVPQQTFGLVPDIGILTEPHWVTLRRGSVVGTGWARHGTAGPWSFDAADRRAYRDDPRFAYLDRALAVGSERVEWQTRVIRAARIASLATIMQRPSTRIVLLGTALEALLGNRFQARDPGAGADRLARRAAYLWCATDMLPPQPHGIDGRPACGFLTSKKDPIKNSTLNPGFWRCSYYGYMRDLYDDRSAALHGAELEWDHRLASQHQAHLEAVLLNAVAWIVRTSPTSIDDLDAEITSLPAASA
jgi:hypothetical protein